MGNSNNTIPEKTVEGLRKRYPQMHPLVFHRSIERSESGGELFDILEEVPEGYPLVWNENHRRWIITEDLQQSSKFARKELTGGKK